MFCLRKNSLVYGDAAYGMSTATDFVNYNGSYAPIIRVIDELKVPDSDVTLIGLLSRIEYTNQIEDTWFNAQNLSDSENSLGVPAYKETYPSSFLACSQRYQLCTTDGSHCSPHTGLYGIPHEDDDLKDLAPMQRAVFQLVWKMLWYAQLNFQLIFIGRENLIANDYLWDGGTQFGLSASLPSNHWQTEVSNFFNVSLAMLQRGAPAFAQPPEFDFGNTNPTQTTNNSILRFIQEPADPETQQLCASIKMRSKAHTSFNVLGLFLLVGLGLFVMLLNGVLPEAVAYFQMRTGRGAYKRPEWVESNAFQLQRMAAEGQGIGPWMGKESDVPTLVERGQVFNLTGMSLRQKGGSMGLQGSGGYWAVGMGEAGIDAVERGDSKKRLLDA